MAKKKAVTWETQTQKSETPELVDNHLFIFHPEGAVLAVQSGPV